MNFISHYRGAMDRFVRDTRPTQTHVALYLALFYHWNLNRFVVPMPVARDDIMRLCCMRVPRIYYQCIRDLHNWGYLKYEPTHDTNRSTLVYMHRFDRRRGSTGDQVSDEPSDQLNAQPGDQLNDQPSAQPLLNSIINDKNDLNELNDLNYESSNKNSNFIDCGRQQPDAEKIGAGDHPGWPGGDGNRTEKNGNPGGGGGRPNSLEEVKAYFAEQKYSPLQAEKFFNHYSGYGWASTQSGRPIEDWRFVANNWVLNANKFNHEPTIKPGAIHVAQHKNYKQPL